MKLTDKERMQLDKYILIQGKETIGGEVVSALETVLWVDPIRTDSTKINDAIFRIYLLTKIAAESTIPTQVLREWCRRYTGSIPEPVDLTKIIPNGD